MYIKFDIENPKLNLNNVEFEFIIHKLLEKYLETLGYERHQSNEYLAKKGKRKNIMHLMDVITDRCLGVTDNDLENYDICLTPDEIGNLSFCLGNDFCPDMKWKKF